jgi:hypothetical protein
MALTGLHTDWVKGSYLNDRNYFMKQKENPTGPYTRPYYDLSIAIGYGFDLIQHSASEITAYLNRVNDALGLQGTQRVTLSQHDITLLNEARTATPARRNAISQQLNLRFPSQNYATTLLGIMLNEYEIALDAALGSPSELLQSKERTAIISLIYTMTEPTSAAILNTIPATIEAIKRDNRAEVWYEIRYNSNRRGRNTARRYSEANQFGLYDGGTLTADQQTAQAKEIMRMYTRYEVFDQKLSTYEGNHTAKPANSINAEVQPASDYLVTNFAMGNTIDGLVLVGKGLDSYDYIEQGNWNDYFGGRGGLSDLIFGEKGDDKLWGYAGNDVIYGGEGDDTLIGGSGNDTLIGGEDDDTYIIKYGEGTDTIIDTQGRNKIIYKDIDGKERITNNFYTSSSGSVITADGKATLTHHSPWQIVFDDGTVIELGEGCTPENFDINLVTLSTDPNTTNFILGDLTPVDFENQRRAA